MNSIEIFGKHGITYEDHHFKVRDRGDRESAKHSRASALSVLMSAHLRSLCPLLAPQDKDGQFQPSPPKDLDKLYKQGPPQRVYIEAQINSLKQQTMCCGVYTLLGNEVRCVAPVLAWQHLARPVLASHWHRPRSRSS